MSFKKIMSISGTGGLFKVIAQTKNGFVVESLVDGKRTAVSSYQKISILEDVSVYGKTDDVPLRKIFQMMDNMSDRSMSMNPKADYAELYKFLDEVFPDNDGERIQHYDIKKMIQWYQLLKGKISFADEPTEDTQDATPEKPLVEDTIAAAPKAKKSAAKQADEDEEPAKKTARKKKNEA